MAIFVIEYYLVFADAVDLIKKMKNYRAAGLIFGSLLKYFKRLDATRNLLILRILTS